MDAKVLVVFLIALVLALSTKQGKHLDIRRFGSKPIISSYILCKFWGFSKRISPKQLFSPFWTEFESKQQVNKH